MIPAGVALFSALAPAHDVITTKLTFSREISRIIYKRCVSCHRPGTQAPMSLLTYQQARPWAKAIKEEVLERRMPPWGAVKGFGDFAGDMGLTQEEIHLIADWVEGGAPEGDPALMPDPPRGEQPAAPTATGESLVVRGRERLAREVKINAIRPEGLKEGASLTAVAELPDGRVEPLVWIYNFKPKFLRTYVYRHPVHLTAGSKVVVTGAGGVRLLVSAAPSQLH